MPPPMTGQGNVEMMSSMSSSDSITRMVRVALEENRDADPEKSVLAQAVSVRYKERYLKACAQRSSCRWSITQSFGAQLGCDCDKESMA